MSDEYNKPNGIGLSRVYKAAMCSARGFSFAWRYESSFRQEAIIAAVLLPSTFWLAQSLVHWCVLIGGLCFLLFAEILNSAIETLADRLTLEHDTMIGRAKDLGSAAVLIAITFVSILWVSALAVRLFNLSL